MKLIIDIPESAYETCKSIKDVESEQGNIVDLMLDAIANGTPLDKIKSEIASYKDDKIIHAEQNGMIDIMLGIIDKYRGEQE